ncbi:MAG: beta/gamma crystallin-related protein [Caldimonas sp.]
MVIPSNRALGSAWARAAVAALCFGAGAASAAEITLYEHANFAGSQLTLRGYTSDIARTGFNDRASSIVVASGRWELCTEAEFKGTCAVFTRGEYPVIDSRLNDRISSARETGSYGDRRGNYNDYGRGAIELYDQGNFNGRSIRLDADTASLGSSGFNDRATSVNVLQGTWELCSDADFSGNCRTYPPGRYPDLGYGMARQVSSARLLRSVGEAPAVHGPGHPAPPPGQAGRAVLYREHGLRGGSLALSGPVPDLERANFNDASSSLYVESGVWVACRDSFFRGDCRTYGPGRYDDLGPGFDRAISSIGPGAASPPPANAVPPQPAPVPQPTDAAIDFFSEPDFGGSRIRVDRDLRDLARVNFNDQVASVVVLAGTWEMCTDARFGGNCAVYRPGRYPNLGGLTRQVSSVRRVQ